METLITYFGDESTLLFKWQDLVGSIIGVAGALLTVVLGLVLSHLYQKWKEVRDGIIQTEIALALGLNDIYDTERHLTDFLVRLDRSVIQPLQNNEHPGQYFFNKTNFPPISIHIDSSLLKAKHRSYYVHNKILIIHKNIGKTNEMFREMKIEYENIIDMGRFLITNGANPDNQRREYLANNQSFRVFVVDMIAQLQIAKKIFAQTKIYNLKLLHKQRFSVWRLEGASFKFFCNGQEIEKYKGTLHCLDRIDNVIEDEVNKVMKEAEERQTTLSNQDETKKSFIECVRAIYKDVMSKLGFPNK